MSLCSLPVLHPTVTSVELNPDVTANLELSLRNRRNVPSSGPAFKPSLSVFCLCFHFPFQLVYVPHALAFKQAYAIKVWTRPHAPHCFVLGDSLLDILKGNSFLLKVSAVDAPFRNGLRRREFSFGTLMGSPRVPRRWWGFWFSRRSRPV